MGAKLGIGWKIVQKYSFFCIFLVIPEVKGGCHVPEICNWTCSDILGGGGTENIALKYLGL